MKKIKTTVILIITLVLSMFLNVKAKLQYSIGNPLYFSTKMQLINPAEKTMAVAQASVPRENIMSKNDDGISKTFSLSQNYPNPFNPVTTINYSVPTDGFVTIKMYDNIGREVMTLVNKQQTAGSYEIVFNGQQITSGVYFYKIETNDFTQVKRMMLIK